MQIPKAPAERKEKAVILPEPPIPGAVLVRFTDTPFAHRGALSLPLDATASFATFFGGASGPLTGEAFPLIPAF
jgi:hypothetical protein